MLNTFLLDSQHGVKLKKVIIVEFFYTYPVFMQTLVETVPVNNIVSPGRDHRNVVAIHVMLVAKVAKVAQIPDKVVRYVLRIKPIVFDKSCVACVVFKKVDQLLYLMRPPSFAVFAHEKTARM